MVIRRLQAERRTGSVHRPKTGVLPTVLRNQPLNVQGASIKRQNSYLSETTYFDSYSQLLSALPLHVFSAASTPYKRCSKCTMEKVREMFLQQLGGVHKCPLVTVVTRCQILRLKCTKFNFGCGSDPDPTVGAYSAPQTDPLSGFKGACF